LGAECGGAHRSRRVARVAACRSRRARRARRKRVCPFAPDGGSLLVMARSDLPKGAVTFLFTDVEGSTKLLHELAAGAYAKALAEHRRALRQAFTAHGGVEVDTQGDAFFVAFPTASAALAAAARGLDELTAGPIRVRMGVHTGTPHLTAEG